MQGLLLYLFLVFIPNLNPHHQITQTVPEAISTPLYGIKVLTFLLVGRPERRNFLTNHLFTAYHHKFRIEMPIYHNVHSTQETIHPILYPSLERLPSQNPVLEFPTCHCREENPLNVIFPFLLFHLQNILQIYYI